MFIFNLFKQDIHIKVVNPVYIRKSFKKYMFEAIHPKTEPHAIHQIQLNPINYLQSGGVTSVSVMRGWGCEDSILPVHQFVVT